MYIAHKQGSIKIKINKPKGLEQITNFWKIINQIKSSG